jgi:hypothetical protein
MNKRIQRKRVRGWRMPPNTVYVGRPTRWGNPYPKYWFDSLSFYREWLKFQISDNPDFLKPLEGKDLACWCPPADKCHADIILEVLQDE